ncbi:MAG: hypothetical protein FWB90_09870 [Fibromonadales bacterium]|nr:hypothetical protein [Fibromonadales bacterium]
MPSYIAILFALPLLLSCSESAEAKLLAQKKAEEIELENARKAEEVEQEKARKAQTEFETKLKAEYEKKFGVPISDFELSITNIKYLTRVAYPYSPILISATRTATGAIVKYGKNELEIELDIGEWLDFINALHKCKIKEKKNIGSYSELSREDRELKIQFLSSEELVFAFQIYWKDWSDVIKTMDAMVAKIIKDGKPKLEAKLKSEYEKRFGAPISDFELSISHIFFYSPRKSLPILRMNATRTVNGALITYYVDYERRNTTGFYDESRFGFNVDLELDIGKWLDFVNALNKCNVGKWEKDKNEKGFNWWRLRISSLDKEIFTFEEVPVNWDEFIKIIESFGVKAREKAVEKADSIRKAKL